LRVDPVPILPPLQAQTPPLRRAPCSQTPGLFVGPWAITWAALGGLVLGGCGGGDSLLLPSEGEPSTIEVVLGDGQSGRVTEPLAQPVVVQVSDGSGRPVEGATVAFQLTSADPNTEITPDTVASDANGEVRAQITLGTTTGVQRGEARLVTGDGGVPQSASFTATALPEDANSMAAVGGEDQTGHVGSALDEPLVVQVTDVFGNPISGVPITWEAEGGGTVSEETVNTDDDGKASVQRILGPATGQQTTIATSVGLAGSPVTFIHTALAGNASRLTIVSGDNQTGRVGSQLPAELVVRLIDGEGNGVPNTAVAWVVATGGGSVTPGNSNTDEEGRTSARWTLGGTPGANRLDAVVSGVGVVSFDATATSGSPAALAIVTQPSSSAQNGIPLGRQPVIQLRDAGGNPVATAGVPISAAIGAGSGTLTGTRQRITDGNGRATFSDLAISGPVGRYTLVFSSGGFASATSSGIDLRAIPTVTTITSDSPDPSAPGAAFTVEFRVTSDGPTPDGAVTVTDGAEGCTGELSGGSGRCQLALNTSGVRTLRATYAGGPGLSGSSATESHTVSAAPPPPPPPPGETVTTITEDSPDPSVSGTTLTIRFTVTASGAIPEGTVRITVSDGTPTCTGTLSGGTGSCELTLKTVGDRTLTATYSGGAGLAGSSDTEPHRVDPPQPENQEPFADFNWHCEDLTCQFTDNSSDPNGNTTIASRHWDFGDGATAGNELNLSHTYATPGNYRVTLTVTDAGGLSDDSRDTVDPKAPNQSPTAEFSSQCDELECEFDDASSDSDGRIEDRLWEFGDGGTSNDRNPKHEYETGGTYTVKLTVTDNDGASTSVEHTVTVNGPNQPPTAEFTWSCSNLKCQFTDTSADADGGIASWSWNFDDGSGSTEQNPPHSFPEARTYRVRLTVTDTRGDSRSVDHDVSVSAPPVNARPTASFIAPTCTVNVPCDFDGSPSTDAEGPVAGWSWTFSEGDPQSGVTVPHTYTTPGGHTATLVVTDQDGASSDPVTQPVTVNP
jgi:PKD repeat protein